NPAHASCEALPMAWGEPCSTRFLRRRDQGFLRRRDEELHARPGDLGAQARPLASPEEREGLPVGNEKRVHGFDAGEGAVRFLGVAVTLEAALHRLHDLEAQEALGAMAPVV